MAVQRDRELGYALAGRGDCREHRWLPMVGRSDGRTVRLRALTVRLSDRPTVRPVVVGGQVAKRVAPAQAQHHFDLLPQRVAPGAVALVDHEHVGDLHHARLQCLDGIAGLRDQHERGGLGAAGDVELRLPHADRFDEDAIETERLEDVGHLFRRRGEAAEGAAGRHRADEHAGIEAHRLHADAVAEQRATGERARRVHRNHRDAEILPAVALHEALGEGALPRSRRSREADATRATAADAGVRVGEHVFTAGAAVLHEADGPGQGGGVAAIERVHQSPGRHA